MAFPTAVLAERAGRGRQYRGRKGSLEAGRVFSLDPAAMPKTYESKKSKASRVLLQNV